MVARLPVDLLDQLEAEAARRGITTEALVDELLVTTLPIVLAEAAEDHLRCSLAIARAAEKSPENEQAGLARPASLQTHSTTGGQNDHNTT
jgi:histidine ammonia-lyase